MFGRMQPWPIQVAVPTFTQRPKSFNSIIWPRLGAAAFLKYFCIFTATCCFHCFESLLFSMIYSLSWNIVKKVHVSHVWNFEETVFPLITAYHENGTHSSRTDRRTSSLNRSKILAVYIPFTSGMLLRCICLKKVTCIYKPTEPNQ